MWNRGMISRRTAAAGMLGCAVQACAPERASSAVRVFAASSLTDALSQIGAAFETAGNTAPVLNFAASSILARQIEQGAPADLFVSADENWMDYLAQHDLIHTATRSSVLSNSIVLVVPADSALDLQIGEGFDLAGALNGGRLAMADPDSVPAGRYARAALEHLGVWRSVEAAVVRAENVRTALRFVELGEAAAGIVYKTDAMIARGRVRIAGEFPQQSHPQISYPMAVVRGGRADEAMAFAEFLHAPAAREIFSRLGFVVL